MDNLHTGNQEYKSPKKVELIVGISATGNLAGRAGFCAKLMYGSHEKFIEGGFLNTPPARITLHGIWAGMLSLKQSCDLTVLIQNEIVINAFEHLWIVDWADRGLLARPTNSIKHTDLYGLIWDLVQGHAVKFRQPTTAKEIQIMEKLKAKAKRIKKFGTLEADFARFENSSFDVNQI